jgi:uncharacterized membrane protein
MTIDIKTVLKISITITVIDILWLYFFFGKPFGAMLEGIQKEKMNFSPLKGILAYIILILAAITLIPKTSSVQEAFLFGALIYGVYDSTNYALLNDYDGKLAVIDTVWGGILFSIVYLVNKHL